MEEKDGGEKVRLGMVVSHFVLMESRHGLMFENTGHSRKLRCDARGIGENRRRTREPGVMKLYKETRMRK